MRRSFHGSICALACVLCACGPEPEAEGPPPGIGSIQHALSSIDCAKSKDTGYVSGKPFSIVVVHVDGKPVQIDTANAYYVMAKAAADKGVMIKVVSGFRTNAEQQYFYNCYINCSCNHCNLAAKPGYSNHQSGHALDLNTSASGVLTWLNNNGSRYGFKRTVPSENWHWEWWGGGPGGGPCTDEPTFPLLTISSKATTLAGQERDFCKAGESDGIFDLNVAQQVPITVDVKNAGTAVARNTTVGIWAEEPHLKVKSWRILSNWNTADGAFKVNDANDLQTTPRADPGQTFTLNLKSISPKETKRVELTVAAVEPSIGAVDHPDIRAWVAHVDDFYEKQDFAAKPNNVKDYQQQNGGDLKAAFQADVHGEETCNGQDDDCDGEVDEDLPECAPAPPGSDGGIEQQPAGGTDSGVMSMEEPEGGVIQGGCALAGGPAAPALPWLLALCAWVVRRTSSADHQS